MFMSIRDVGLFVRGARIDGAIRRLTESSGSRAAFETLYAELGDPWGCENRQYRYQSQKYAGILSVLPKGRRFRRALDLGCGLGALSRALAPYADEVLGLDIAQEAVDHARRRATGIPNLGFDQADVLTLPRSLDGQFDLVVAADTLYYLPAPIEDRTLKAAALRFSELLAPGGLCVLANHYFFTGHPEAPLTRRIHQAFAWSPGLRLLSKRWRPFYLVHVLQQEGRN